VLTRVGATDFSNEASARRAASEVSEVLDFCTKHLTTENTHVHPAIESRRPGAAVRLGRDHEEHEQAIAELRSYVAQVTSCAPEARRAEGRRLYLRFSSFVGENLIHMVEEEELAQAVLEEIYSVEELAQLHGRMMATMDADQKYAFFRIMLPAVESGERAVLFSAALATFSLDRNATLVAGLRDQIDDKEWQELASRLVRSV
jgi:hypothetical protein